MKISTKGRYALRFMLDLSKHENANECIKLNKIAERQNISEKYLEQIVAVLNKTGLVKSVRGAQGGYRLTRDPKDYKIGDILRAIEGSLAPVECLEEGAPPCSRMSDCTTVKVWRELYDAINSVVDKYTLADLIEMEALHEPIFMI